MKDHGYPAEAKIERAAKACMEAAGRRDAKALDCVLAATFSPLTNRGSLIDKTQRLENIPGFTPLELLDARVRVDSDVAFMIARNLLRAIFDGADRSVALTEVWGRRDDRRRLVRRHASTSGAA